MFFDIWAENGAIAMCFRCFPVFWISGAGEREITSGNLPLSEVPPSDSLTEYRRFPAGFYGGYPE